MPVYAQPSGDEYSSRPNYGNAVGSLAEAVSQIGQAMQQRRQAQQARSILQTLLAEQAGQEQTVGQSQISAGIAESPTALSGRVPGETRPRVAAPSRIGELLAQQPQRRGALSPVEQFVLEATLKNKFESPLVKQTQQTELESKRADIGLKHAQTEEAKRKPEEERLKVAREQGKETFDRSNTLRDEFRSSAVFKNYQEIERAQKNIHSAYVTSTDPKTKSRIASDQALGVSIQKMLDPGSVVRESEYSRTQEGAAAINQLSGRATQLVKGGLRLADSDRLEIKNLADTILANAKGSLKGEIGRFGKLADDFAVPRDYVFGGLDLELDEPGQAADRPAQTAPSAGISRQDAMAELRKRGRIR